MLETIYLGNFSYAIVFEIISDFKFTNSFKIYLVKTLTAYHWVKEIQFLLENVWNQE